MTKENSSLVYSLAEAGSKLGLGRNATYDAAARGDIPTIRVGKLLKVPKAAFDRLLGVQQEGASALTPVPPPQHQPQEIRRVRNVVRKQEPRIQVNLAITVELNNKLVESANARGLTLTGEIRERLIRSFEDTQ